MLIQLIIHKHYNTGAPAGLLFLDLAHAYDYISQEFIMNILETMDFPWSFRNAVATLMNQQYGRVIVNGDLSPVFPVKMAVSRGTHFSH